MTSKDSGFDDTRKYWKRLKPYHISGIFCGLTIVFVVIGSILQATGQPKNATDAMWALVGICGAIFVLFGILHCTDTQIVQNINDPAPPDAEEAKRKTKAQQQENHFQDRSQNNQQEEAIRIQNMQQREQLTKVSQENGIRKMRCQLETDDFFTLEPLLSTSTETKSMWLLS